MPELAGRNQRKYIKATRQLRKVDTTCWICGREIDVTLPYTDRMSWTADHLKPLALGGELLGEMRAAHRSCNSRRGTGQPAKREQLPTSRRWFGA